MSCLESVFDEPLSPEARYWVGFLMGDGCIATRKGRPYSVIINLSSRDISHIEKFRDFLHSDAKISATKLGVWSKVGTNSVGITSLKICSKLNDLGVTPRKTHSARVHDSLSKNADFWRGLIDADGTLHQRKSNHDLPIIQVGGSLELIKQFVSFVMCVTGKSPAITSHRSIFASGISGKFAQQFAKTVYYDNCFALERKQKIAEQIKRWR